ncbi:MAG: hypothetical protein ACI8PZ_002120 [Myxococcota bacterium]|jgi:hypothetical protein
MRTLALFALAACTVSPAPESADWSVDAHEPLPPPEITLTMPDPLRAGVGNRVTVAGDVAWGELAYLVASGTGAGDGPCIRAAGVCLDILDPARLLGAAEVGEDGVAVFDLDLPPRLIRDSPYVFQAVVIRGVGGAASIVSDVALREIADIPPGVHLTEPWTSDGVNSAPFDCSFPDYQNTYEYLDLGAMTWNECAIAASARGAMHGPDDSYSAGNGWFGFRDGSEAMIEGWSVAVMAGADSDQRCVLARDPAASRDTDVLDSTVDAHDLRWWYADLGVMFYDECATAAGNAGATMVPPMSLGLPQSGGYWVKSVHGCNVYGYISDSGDLQHENVGYGARSSTQNCMIAYVE